MVKYYNFDIVFAEIPNEVTMAINITNCPNRCVDCHSPHLQKDIGFELTEEEYTLLIEKYIYDVTCICFMGGDANPQEIEELAQFSKKKFPSLKTAWYSGMASIPETIDQKSFDYIKIGAYIPAKGPLNKPTTNQRLYAIEADGSRTDITSLFWKH